LDCTVAMVRWCASFDLREAWAPWPPHDGRQRWATTTTTVIPSHNHSLQSSPTISHTTAISLLNPSQEMVAPTPDLLDMPSTRFAICCNCCRFAGQQRPRGPRSAPASSPATSLEDDPATYPCFALSSRPISAPVCGMPRSFPVHRHPRCPTSIVAIPLNYGTSSASGPSQPPLDLQRQLTVKRANQP
jgi:hypothetical protein